MSNDKFPEYKINHNTVVDCVDLTVDNNEDDDENKAVIIKDAPGIKIEPGSNKFPPMTQVFTQAPPMTQLSQPLLDNIADEDDSSLDKKPKARVLFVDDEKPPQKRKGKKSQTTKSGKPKPMKPFASSTPLLQTKLSLFPVDMPPRKVPPRSIQRKRHDEDGGADEYLRNAIAEAKQKKEEAKKKAWSVELQSRTAISFGLCKYKK